MDGPEEGIYPFCPLRRFGLEALQDTPRSGLRPALRLRSEQAQAGKSLRFINSVPMEEA